MSRRSGSSKPPTRPRPWIPSGSGGTTHNKFAQESIAARQRQLQPPSHTPAPSRAAAQQPQPLPQVQPPSRAKENWRRAFKAATELTTGPKLSGEAGPPPNAAPNAVYQRKNKAGEVIQNTIYNQAGQTIAQVDFKQHGSAPPGHSHRTATPGDIASAHSGSGGSDVHYPPDITPARWRKK